MPYTVLLDEFLDLSGSIDWSAVVGGIWVPPPSDGTSPATPSTAGTATAVSPPTLTFPALDAPPATASAMLISQPPLGDLYRLASPPPPANPVHLNGINQPAPPLDQQELDSLTASIGPQTTAIPGNPFWWTFGTWVPRSITVSAVTMTLPEAPATGTLTLTLTGTIHVSHWFGSSDNPFTFTETVALAPSGDPVDTSRTLAATGSSPSMTITGGGFAAGLMAGPLHDQATPDLEARFNQGISANVATTLAGLTPPQQLAPATVISANHVVITHGGLALNVSLANISGPALVPLQAPPQTTVPDVYGLTVPDALKAIEEAHLRMRTIDDGRPDRFTIPTVEDESPEPGATVPLGTVVTCTLKVHRGAGN
jgi:PASTA domain